MTVLSRLAITGPITIYNTPVCVLLEIGKCHGFGVNADDMFDTEYRSNLIEMLHDEGARHVTPPYTRNDLRLIARYVNPDITSWSTGCLIQAFDVLQSYASKSSLPEAFDLGQQTPDNVRSINACVLYRVCRHAGLPLTLNTSMEQMYALYKLVTTPVEALHAMALRLLQAGTPSHVASMIHATGQMDIDMSLPGVITEAPTHKGMIQAKLGLSNTTEIKRRLTPRDVNEAIYLAADIYKVNLVKASNPIREYCHLRTFASSDSYRPIDIKVKQLYDINPDLIRIDRVFEPALPQIYYSRTAIDYLLRQEGLSNSELLRVNGIEYLQLAYYSDSFHSGRQVISNTETPFDCDDVADIHANELICYGSRSQPMTAFTASELMQCFRVNGSFSNPFERGIVFTSEQIRKLKHICSINQDNSNKTGLLAEIALIEESIDNRSSFGVGFVRSYRQCSDPKTKLSIEMALTSLLHLSMYMRGWSGIGEYPIEEAPVDNQNEVDIRVTQSIAALDKAGNAMSDGFDVRRLPLLKKSGHGYITAGVNDGLTVGGRLEIVKNGIRHENANSCLRMSSNWFASTAYKYIVSIGLPQPFDISSLRMVS